MRVTEPFRLALSEMLDRKRAVPCIRRYELRGSGLTVHLRQPWYDVWVFDEIFARGVYAPPKPVLDALNARRPLRIVDLGGHVGIAALFFLSLFPESRITAFEPDATNADLLRRTIAANGLEDSWQLVPACAGPEDGIGDFVSGTGSMGHLATKTHNGNAFAELGGVKREVPMRDVFPYLADVDLLKIDIEGGEWAILQDSRFSDVPATALVLEFHSFFGPDDPTEAIGRYLGDAGYELGPVIDHRPELGEGIVWAWRPQPNTRTPLGQPAVD